MCIRDRVSKEDLADVKALVKALKEQGVLLEEKGKYIATRNRGYYPCEIVRVHGTFGFARIRGEMRDIFIPGKYLMGTMPGDLVVVKPDGVEDLTHSPKKIIVL